MRRFTIVLTPDPDEGGFTVTVPSLPGCITEGDTYEEALANAQEAIALHLESLAADGEPIPDDSPPPLIAVVEIADELVAAS
jgi:predicted RNase H-like HicB family nuclease